MSSAYSSTHEAGSACPTARRVRLVCGRVARQVPNLSRIGKGDCVCRLFWFSTFFRGLNHRGTVGSWGEFWGSRSVHTVVGVHAMGDLQPSEYESTKRIRIEPGLNTHYTRSEYDRIRSVYSVSTKGMRAGHESGKSIPRNGESYTHHGADPSRTPLFPTAHLLRRSVVDHAVAVGYSRGKLTVHLGMT
jgi:hypothetical protein